MSKHKYLSIGEISKLSGAHIKSLRYYDRIGVLKPAYIDPDTSFRYYTFSQLGIIEAIQTCVELGIPLKEFSQYSEDSGQKIHYAKLLKHGEELADSRIRAMRDGLKVMKELQREIERNEAHAGLEAPIQYEVPQKRYLTETIHEALGYDACRTRLGALFLRMVESGYKPGYEYGFLYRYRNGGVERHLFVEVMAVAKGKKRDLTVIPAGRYVAKHVTESKIETAPEEFPELFATDGGKIAIEAELFTGVYSVTEPVYELRCALERDS